MLEAEPEILRHLGWTALDNSIWKEKFERTFATDIISKIWCGGKNYVGHNLWQWFYSTMFDVRYLYSYNA